MTRHSPNPEHSPARAAEQTAGVGALTIDSKRDGDEHVVRLEGELDLAQAATSIASCCAPRPPTPAGSSSTWRG